MVHPYLNIKNGEKFKQSKKIMEYLIESIATYFKNK